MQSLTASAPPLATAIPTAEPQYRHRCAICCPEGLCAPAARGVHDDNMHGALLHCNKPVRRGKHVYRQDDDFEAIYIVRSGVLKAYASLPEGEEQVVGFYFGGDLVGSDGLGSNRHCNSLVALDTASLCRISFADLDSLSRRFPSLQRTLFRLMSHEIEQEQQHIRLLSKRTAMQRVIALLLFISAKYERQNFSPLSFTLVISRGDIANYLGMNNETASRMFRRLQELELIAECGKTITLLDPERLRRLVRKPLAA